MAAPLSLSAVARPSPPQPQPTAAFNWLACWSPGAAVLSSFLCRHTNRTENKKAAKTLLQAVAANAFVPHAFFAPPPAPLADGSLKLHSGCNPFVPHSLHPLSQRLL